MTNAFFERPILNSPYEYPTRHWELGPDKHRRSASSRPAAWPTSLRRSPRRASARPPTSRPICSFTRIRHAYFLGANDPYKALKTTLKAEIVEEAWASLRGDTSRPFAKPVSGRIAVKVSTTWRRGHEGVQGLRSAAP
jgi:hypothetical protein